MSKDRLSETIDYANNKNNDIEMNLQVGDKTEHFMFGKGVIEKVNYGEKSYTIKFDEFDTMEIGAQIKLNKVE